MKKLLLIITILTCVLSVHAQSNIDKKLLKKYSKKELKVLKENPQDYNFEKYCVKNAYRISEVPKDKITANPNYFIPITVKDITDINFFELNIELKEIDFQAFVINGTTKVLMIKSKNALLKEFKKSQL